MTSEKISSRSRLVAALDNEIAAAAKTDIADVLGEGDSDPFTDCDPDPVNEIQEDDDELNSNEVVLEDNC